MTAQSGTVFNQIQHASCNFRMRSIHPTNGWETCTCDYGTFLAQIFIYVGSDTAIITEAVDDGIIKTFEIGRILFKNGVVKSAVESEFLQFFMTALKSPEDHRHIIGQLRPDTVVERVFFAVTLQNPGISSRKQPGFHRQTQHIRLDRQSNLAPVPKRFGRKCFGFAGFIDFDFKKRVFLIPDKTCPSNLNEIKCENRKRQCRQNKQSEIFHHLPSTTYCIWNGLVYKM